MNKWFYNTLVVVAAVVALLGAEAVPGICADAPPAQPVIGVVDVQKVFSEYKLTKTSNEKIQKQMANYKTELDVRKNNKLLTEDELQQLIKLKEEAKPTDADQKQIDQLEQKSKQLDEEMTTLIQKTNPTDTETARLKELRQRSNQNETNGSNLADEYSQQLDKLKSQLSDQITSDIKAAIATVAKQKGIATVVDKIAVLYGGVDITNEVVKTLNAG